MPNSSTQKPFTIVETFVGCGGAHLGFKNVGFESLLVNDIDQNMLDTLIKNNVIDKNKCFTSPMEDLTEKLLQKYVRNKKVDVLFGGIVCKGFSLAGVRNPFDTRNYLYKHQLNLVKILRPKVSIIENVPTLKNMCLYNKCDETITVFEQYSLLSDLNKRLNGEKSSKRKKEEDYSSLTTQIKGNKKKMKILLKGIESHKYYILEDIKKMYKELGYTLYIKILKVNKYGGYTSRKRLILVAVRDDLNKIYEYPKETDTTRVLNDALNQIDYEGINNPKTDIDNRPMKHNKKTIARFKFVPEGKNIAEIVDTLPPELKISSFYSRGNTKRLHRNELVPTLVPGHSNFPIHPWEDRQITVREAATITGFPLDYTFCGSHTSRCMQIGNAVPVQLSEAIARSVLKILE